MSNKGISIMLIDDNRIDLFIHNEFIKQMGIASSVSEYGFANEALNFLQNNSIEKWPHLILLDIHMPIMNGFDFINKYAELPLENRNKCHIVVVSSSLDSGDIMKSNESPYVLKLLEKPLNTEKLMKILRENNIIHL